jgi:hypothetical protein
LSGAPTAELSFSNLAVEKISTAEQHQTVDLVAAAAHNEFVLTLSQSVGTLLQNLLLWWNFKRNLTRLRFFLMPAELATTLPTALVWSLLRCGKKLFAPSGEHSNPSAECKRLSASTRPSHADRSAEVRGQRLLYLASMGL